MGISCFRDFFRREFFHSALFPFFSSCFKVLERGLRESSKLRFSLSIYAFGLTNYQDSTIVLPLASIYTSLFFSLFSSLILGLGFCVFYDVYQIEC